MINKSVLMTAFWVVLTMFNLFAAVGLVGYAPMYQFTYGFVTIMAAYIAVTFVYLYIRSGRAIGLAMVVSWTGTMGVQGWWWIYSVLGRSQWMADNQSLLMIPLSFYIVGTVLHSSAFFKEVGGKFRFQFLIPTSVSALVSAIVTYLAH